MTVRLSAPIAAAQTLSNGQLVQFAAGEFTAAGLTTGTANVFVVELIEGPAGAKTANAVSSGECLATVNATSAIAPGDELMWGASGLVPYVAGGGVVAVGIALVAHGSGIKRIRVDLFPRGVA